MQNVSLCVRKHAHVKVRLFRTFTQVFFVFREFPSENCFFQRLFEWRSLKLRTMNRVLLFKKMVSFYRFLHNFLKVFSYLVKTNICFCAGIVEIPVEEGEEVNDEESNMETVDLGLDDS